MVIWPGTATMLSASAWTMPTLSFVGDTFGPDFNNGPAWPSSSVPRWLAEILAVIDEAKRERAWRHHLAALALRGASGVKRAAEHAAMPAARGTTRPPKVLASARGAHRGFLARIRATIGRSGWLRSLKTG